MVDYKVSIYNAARDNNLVALKVSAHIFFDGFLFQMKMAWVIIIVVVVILWIIDAKVVQFWMVAFSFRFIENSCYNNTS